MTDVRTLVAYLAAVVTTLAEIGGGPEGTFYAALSVHGADFEDWERVRDLALRQGYVTIKANWVELTDAGRALAAELEEAVARG